MRYSLFNHRARVLVPSLVSASVFGFFVACAPNGGKVPVKLSSGGVAVNAAKAAVAKIYTSYDSNNADNIDLASRVQGLSAQLSPVSGGTPTLGLADTSGAPNANAQVADADSSSAAALDSVATGVGTTTADTAPAAPATKQFYTANVQMLVTDQTNDSRDNQAFTLSASGVIYAGEDADHSAANLGVASAATGAAAVTTTAADSSGAPVVSTDSATPAPTSTPATTAAAANPPTVTPAPAAPTAPSSKTQAVVLAFDKTTSDSAVGRFKIQSYCGNADCTMLLVRLLERQTDPSSKTPKTRQFAAVFQANPVDPKNPNAARTYAILWNGRSVAKGKAQTTTGRGTPVAAPDTTEKGRKTDYNSAVAGRKQKDWPFAPATGAAATTSPVATVPATPAAPAGKPGNASQGSTPAGPAAPATPSSTGQPTTTGSGTTAPAPGAAPAQTSGSPSVAAPASNIPADQIIDALPPAEAN